jgi:transcriptional regulator with XRE-family HTH domain
MKKTLVKNKIKSTAARSGVKTGAGKNSDLLTSAVHLKETRKAAVATLGERIKSAREKCGLTLKDISSRTGISTAVLKKVEADALTPPLGQLIRLGKALDMKMGYFISPGSDKPMAVVRKNERRPVARYGEKKSAQYGYYYESLAADKGNRVMEPFIVTLLPSGKEEPSSHDGQEFLFVLHGHMKVTVAGHEELLLPGDAVYYDSTQPHYVGTVGKKKTVILAVLYAGAK